MPKTSMFPPGLTMACYLESRRPTAERKAAWHKDCINPAGCPCPAHGKDDPASERRRG